MLGIRISHSSIDKRRPAAKNQGLPLLPIMKSRQRNVERDESRDGSGEESGWELKIKAYGDRFSTSL
jgi:hypothetical protein